MVDGLVKVRNGLGLNTLRSIHHQQRPLAGRNGARHFVTEVHVPGGVDEVEPVGLSVAPVVHLDGVALDGDAFLPFQVHVVQHLVFHLPVAQGLGEFQQTVCQGRFTMVDMGDDAEIANILHKSAKITQFAQNPNLNIRAGGSSRSLHGLQGPGHRGRCDSR